MVIFFEKNGILHVMLTYYIKLYKYIHFLLLYLQFCDHSKRILTDWITQWKKAVQMHADLPWSSTLVHRRAASSAHSCTPCTHTTVIFTNYNFRQICWWHNGDRPDHRQRWDGLQRGGEYPDYMVPGEPPLTQHRQDQGAGGGLQETEQRTHTHHHRQDPCGAGDQL